MNIRTKSVLLGICLLAQMSFGAETVASFVKQSLGFDLATISFGTTTATNDEYQPAGSPISMPVTETPTNVVWLTNSVSAKYHQDFPNRILRYGFHDGRFVSLRISIDSIKAMGDQDLFKQQRAELIHIQDEYTKANPNRRLNKEDSSFQIHYHAMCAPTVDSLYIAEFEITPAEKKKAP